MNQERSRSENQPLSHVESNRIAERKNQVKLTNLRQVGQRLLRRKTTEPALTVGQTREQSSNFHQSSPLNQPLWFWSQHSSWSYFNRGLFWGVIISLTSVCSGVLGVASTKIDAVEQAIANRINAKANSLQVGAQAPLARPINILLVEVKPDANEMIDADYSTGNIQTVLLLKFDPELNSTQVINIPIDSKVEIPGNGQGVIADAHRLGGIELLSKTINQLPDGYNFDRYIRATPAIFRQLTASGKIALENCDPRIRDCTDSLERVIRQQTTLETIRQRLNIPSYWSSFKTAVDKVKPNLDTNISVAEIMSLANFFKELESDSISVELLSEYVPGKAIKQENPLSQSLSNKPSKTLAEVKRVSTTQGHTFQNQPIAVQNTTDNPELGRQVVAYLRHRNFRDVYLVRHIPLKLEQTKIVVNNNQVDTANYLKSILGFGNLKQQSALHPEELILQLGEDALHLPTNYRSYNEKVK